MKEMCGYKLGWVRDFQDPRDYHLDHKDVQLFLLASAPFGDSGQPPLPAMYDITEQYDTPKIKDQLSIGSCTATRWPVTSSTVPAATFLPSGSVAIRAAGSSSSTAARADAPRACQRMTPNVEKTRPRGRPRPGSPREKPADGASSRFPPFPSPSQSGQDQ